ncbi:MAG: phage gp6-like head-tail connector protein [Negativicutes bacterium]|nr:phage gp6-like head-tail connector protein [Negativicutes bacterium]
MALIDDVKKSLRISHTKLDTEITATIDVAKAELERAGVIAENVVDTDSLIAEAIKTYCKYSFASDPKMRDGYFISWQYQLDCLRKSTGYGVEADV